MRTMSETWNTLFASNNASLETVAVINGVEYTEISNPIINRALMQDGLSIGNAVSASCQFSVKSTSAVIPRSAEVIIKSRLTDGTSTSEWLADGTFYISSRNIDPVTGILTLECYDALLKANADMPELLPWTDQNGDVITNDQGDWLYISAAYPRSMISLLNDILLVMDIELDPRTTLNSGVAYVINSVEPGTSIHDVLCQIAQANGGNWIMTPENKLRLVPLVSASDASNAAQDVVSIDIVTGSIGVSTNGTITGVRYNNGLVGTETGIVLRTDVSELIAQDLYTRYNGCTYQSYSLTGAMYDPAAELGDYVNRLDNIHSMLCVEKAVFGIAYNADIAAPEPGELADEYPYIGGSAKAATIAKSYTNDQVEGLDGSLDQTGVYNRLTNDGTAQAILLGENGTLYLNANYISAGTLSANRIAAHSIGVAKLSGSISDNGWVIDFDNGTLTLGDLSAASITSGTMSMARISGGTLTFGGDNNENGVLQVQNASGTVVGTLDNDKFVMGTNTDYVKLYGTTPDPFDLDDPPQDIRVPFLVAQEYNSDAYRMLMARGALYIESPTNNVQLGSDGLRFFDNGSSDANLSITVSSSNAYLTTGKNLHIDGADGTEELSISCDTDFTGSIKTNGAAALASGSFTDLNGNIVYVENGLIMSMQ